MTSSQAQERQAFTRANANGCATVSSGDRQNAVRERAQVETKGWNGSPDAGSVQSSQRLSAGPVTRDVGCAVLWSVTPPRAPGGEKC